jgi:hypothetical protein
MGKCDMLIYVHDAFAHARIALDALSRSWDRLGESPPDATDWHYLKNQILTAGNEMLLAQMCLDEIVREYPVRPEGGDPPPTWTTVKGIR